MKGSMSPAAARNAVIQEKTLSNGVKIIARDAPSQMATIKFSVNAGSKNEKINEKGSAHLLSYCAFEGTQQRSGLRLLREMENRAFVVNSKFCREANHFTIKAAPEFVGEAMSTLQEVLFSPPKHNYTIKERKPAASVDYGKLSWCPLMNLSEMTFEAAYGEGTPMGGSVFSHNLQSLCVDDVLAFRSRNFTAGNLVIAADGVSMIDIEKVAASFTGAASAAATSPYTGGCVRRRADFGGDVHASLAFPSLSGPKSGAFRVVHTMLADALAEKTKGSDLGCIKTVREGGLQCVYVSASSTGAAESLIALAVNELKAIASGSHKSTAAQKKVSLCNLISLEGGECATDVMLAADAAGVSLADFADVRGVSGADVQAAAQSMLKAAPSYAVVGASYGMQSYASVCNLLK
jgi:hypothetical protein